LQIDAAVWGSDNNDLYVNSTPGANIGRYYSTVYHTLADWRTRGSDPNSVSVLPVFRAPHLHIDTLGIRSQWVPLANGGVAVAGCEYDFDNDNRITGNVPDIGADEFWIRPNPPTGVENGGSNSPTIYSLEQNYPNPFNPSTTIRYGLPNRSHVTLTVFNTLGQQVSVLQNEEQEAGYHEVEFDGKILSSGVYFYRIQAGDFVQTKRLLLLK
jgi:hypothetical protein